MRRWIKGGCLVLVGVLWGALAAQALDFKAIEAKWQKSRELKDDEMSVKISVTWYAGEYIQALFQQQAEKNLWTQSETDKYAYEFLSSLQLDQYIPVMLAIENTGDKMHMAPFDKQIVLWIGDKRYEPVEYDRRFNFPLLGKIEGLVYFPKFDEKTGKDLLAGASTVKVGFRGSVTPLYSGPGFIDFAFTPGKDNPDAFFSETTKKRMEIDRLLKRLQKLASEKAELEQKLGAVNAELETLHQRMDELQK